ncbi:flagellar hook-length control protein FliK [Maridesulfovibrio bastinii]|uniref:flagellar hook-length control protein FliK n=1 Tax=Maridesulfovibrio bastinii TaxID=47157 RepID=UPI0003FA4EDA|nr:flagellar hook-length control protein FliK [Maridesulfovibrio bastinii]
MKILPHLNQDIQEYSGLLNSSPDLESSYRSAMFDNFMHSFDGAASTLMNDTSSVMGGLSSNINVESIDYVKEAASEVSISDVDTPPQDMEVSREDWNDIKEGLKKRGLKEKDINELEEKVYSDEGLTYGQLVMGLTEMLQSVKGLNLSPTDLQNVDSMLSKLGFNLKESKELISDLTNGNYKSFMNAISQKLSSLSGDEKISFSSEEADTLTRLFKLSGSDAKKIKALLTKNDTNVADLRNAFSSLKTELEKLAQQEKSKDADLSKLVGEKLHNAMSRESDQSPSIVKMADATTIKDSLGAAKDLAKDAQGNGQQQNQENNQKNPDSNGQQAAGGQDQDDSRQGNHWLDDLLNDSSDSKAWSDFFGKIRTDSESGMGGLEKMMGAGLNNANANLSKLVDSAKTSPMWEKAARSNVLEQVQNGIFRNLGNGSKQLVLKLNPVELGSVNVMLQVKNKEVNAVIRADNPDSARLISDQVDKIRAALEQQGLKVDKLDVQTNLADGQTQSSWQGADQHNNAQQNHDTMLGIVKRWRSVNSGGSSLAQDMQPMSGKAIISQSGLHIVA